MRQGQYFKLTLAALTLTVGSFAFGQQQQQGIQVQQPQQQYQQPSGFDPAVLQGSWKSVCAPQGAFGPSNMVFNGANSQDIEYTFTQDGYGNPAIIFQINTYPNDPTCTSLQGVEVNTNKVGNYFYQGNNTVFNTVGRLSINWGSCSGLDCHFYDPTLSAYSAPIMYLIYANRNGLETLNFATILQTGAIQPAFRSPLVRPINQLAGRH